MQIFTLSTQFVNWLNRNHVVTANRILYRRNNRNQKSRFALWSQGELIGIYSRLRDIKRAIGDVLSFNGYWVEDTETGNLITHRKSERYAIAA